MKCLSLSQTHISHTHLNFLYMWSDAERRGGFVDMNFKSQVYVYRQDNMIVTVRVAFSGKRSRRRSEEASETPSLAAKCRAAPCLSTAPLIALKWLPVRQCSCRRWKSLILPMDPWGGIHKIRCASVGAYALLFVQHKMHSPDDW